LESTIWTAEGLDSAGSVRKQRDVNLRINLVPFQ
jgi:hypothetical protein